MDYREFVPTEADEASVVRALTAWRDIHVAQERTDPLPAGVPELFAAPDAAGAFALGERLVGEHFAMLYAAEADCVPLFRLAMEGHGISRWAAFDRGPDFFLLYACIQGSAGVTRYLLSRGADPRVLHENGPREAFTPLMWAIQGRNQGCVEALLHDPRTDADRIDGRGGTGVAWAVARRNPDALRALLAAGASATVDDAVSAATSRFREGLEMLLDHGVACDTTGKGTGLAPLHGAVVARDADTVGWLLGRGAPRELVSRKKHRKLPGGLTALEMARTLGEAEVVAVLEAG